MKITFFKNESDFYPRCSFCWENAKRIEFNFKMQKVWKCFLLLSMIILLVFMCSFDSQLEKTYGLYVATLFLLLPLHEFCHALFCWISGRKVERICLFPYSRLPLKKRFFAPGAYVKPAFGVWGKGEIILLYAFPFILLSIIPAVLAVFASSLRYWLLFLSLYNLLASSLDIFAALHCFKAPAKYVNLDGTGGWLIASDTSKPIMIHQMFVTPQLDKIHHKCFSYFNGQCSEIEAYDTPQTLTLKQEFREQFHLEK